MILQKSLNIVYLSMIFLINVKKNYIFMHQGRIQFIKSYNKNIYVTKYLYTKKKTLFF